MCRAGRSRCRSARTWRRCWPARSWRRRCPGGRRCRRLASTQGRRGSRLTMSAGRWAWRSSCTTCGCSGPAGGSAAGDVLVRSADGLVTVDRTSAPVWVSDQDVMYDSEAAMQAAGAVPRPVGRMTEKSIRHEAGVGARDRHGAVAGAGWPAGRAWTWRGSGYACSSTGWDALRETFVLLSRRGPAWPTCSRTPEFRGQSGLRGRAGGPACGVVPGRAAACAAVGGRSARRRGAGNAAASLRTAPLPPALAAALGPALRFGWHLAREYLSATPEPVGGVADAVMVMEVMATGVCPGQRCPGAIRSRRAT